MRRIVLWLSRFLAILSGSAALMGVTLMGHSVLTPQTRLPRLHDQGPSVLLRFGIGSLCAAVLLGLLSYALARIASVDPDR